MDIRRIVSHCKAHEELLRPFSALPSSAARLPDAPAWVQRTRNTRRDKPTNKQRDRERERHKQTGTHTLGLTDCWHAGKRPLQISLSMSITEFHPRVNVSGPTKSESDRLRTKKSEDTYGLRLKISRIYGSAPKTSTASWLGLRCLGFSLRPGHSSRPHKLNRIRSQYSRIVAK